MDACTKPHAVVVPYPAQGHINPMMHLARKLASDGFLVTFVNTDFNHARILEARQKMKSGQPSEAGLDAAIRLMSIPDGLPPDEPRTNFAKLNDSMEKSMGPSLRDLIRRINRTQPHAVTCLIADVNVAGWAFDAASHFRIPTVAVWTMLIADYAIFYHIPTLLSSGILPPTGKTGAAVCRIFPLCAPLNHVMCLSSNRRSKGAQNGQISSSPAASPLFPSWMDGRHRRRQRVQLPLHRSKHGKGEERRSGPLQLFLRIGGPRRRWVLPQRSFHLPNRPSHSNHLLHGSPERSDGISTGFWPEEEECLEWLDKQSPRSVIYASFGSLALLNARQFQELALGLEATGRPFLWVVRSDVMDGSAGVFPSGFEERVRERGCLISWAPQLSVLSHPSVACFLTHCGWNSTLEGMVMGVPMICWPYFVDQFLNRAYVVDVWKIGVALNANGDDGIIHRREISEAVERIVGGSEEGVEIKKRVMKLKESAREAVREGGSSAINYNLFVNAVKNGRLMTGRV